MAEQSVVQLFPNDPPEEADEEEGATAEPLSEEHMRILEALLFASAEPVNEVELAARLPEGADCPALLAEIQSRYASRGVNLVRVAKGWAFRTASDLSHLMTREVVEQRRLSRAALEMLAIIAYHQPVTRSEIEDIRGVATSKGTLDLLMEMGWVRISGRRQVPGRPVTFGTTSAFLEHFSLDRLSDLPGVEELSATGLLSMSPGADATEAEPAEEEDIDEAEPEETEDHDFDGSDGYMEAEAQDDRAPE